MTTKQRNLLIGGGITLLLVAILAIGWAIQSNRDTTGDEANAPGEGTSRSAGDEEPTGDASQTPTPSAEESPSDDPGAGDPTGAVPAGLVDEYGLGIGDPDAPVKVEVFADFQCPHCKHFEELAQDQLTASAEDGSAYVVHRPMAFINEYSARAMNALAVVLDASGGEVAHRFNQLLFENQPSGTVPTDEDLIALAVSAGATAEEVRPGIEGLSFQQWVVNANDAASKRGVNSTPTVFVNGQVVPGQSIEELVANTIRGIRAG